MDFETLVGKALSDEEFVRALIANPEQALRDAGVEPTPEMIDALKDVDVEAIQKLAAAFNEDEGAAC